MAGISLNIHQLSKQESTQVYDTPFVIKQENLIPESVKNDFSLNGEFTLDLKSPEFDLENIATECSIDTEKTECLNNFKSKGNSPEIKEKIIEIGIGKRETRINEVESIGPETKNNNLTDKKTYYLAKESLSNNLDKEYILLNEVENLIPKIKNKKHEIGTESPKPESEEDKKLIPTDSTYLDMKDLNEERLIHNFNKDKINHNKLEQIQPIIKIENFDIDIENTSNFDKDQIKLNKSEQTLPIIKRENLEIDNEYIELKINKAVSNTSDTKMFYPTDIRIKNLDGLMSNSKRDDIELMQIESFKTEPNFIIKEEKINFKPVSDFPENHAFQNQNVKFNLLNRNISNNTSNIKINIKSKSVKNSKKKVYKSKNKISFLNTTQIIAEKSKTESGNFECPYCGYKCKYDAIYQDHLLSHVNSIDNNSCRICNFKGKNDQQYKQHMLAGHEETKMHRCVSCDYKNTCESQFRSHLLEKKHKVKCPKCNLVFGTPGDVKRHLIEHETKVYECSVCKKLMKYKQLKSHMLTHTSAFECKLCDYKTWGNKRLKDHMKVHTNEKPFKCQMCTKSFRLECGLKNHMLSHQNRESRKLFECDVCKKTYLSHQALKLHWKTKNHGPNKLSMYIDSIEDIDVKRTKIHPIDF